MFNRKGIFFIILIGSIPFFNIAIAIETCGDSNGCYGYYLSNAQSSYQGNVAYNFNSSTCPVSFSQYSTPYEYHPRIEFSIYQWDGNDWQLKTYFHNYVTWDTLNDIIDYLNAHGIQRNQYPQDYWPNGPPDNCGGQPPCDNSEKFCQTSSCIDSSGNLKFATFVRYQDKDNWTNVPQLSYDNPNFPNDHDCTAHLLNFISESDCFCPDDTDNLPSDLWENYTIAPPSQPVASAQNDKFLCAQQCYPKGYIFTDGNCICFDETQNTELANQPPSDSTDQNPADSPSDPSNEAQQLATINQNLANMISQGNDLNRFLSNIADNVATNTNNQGILNDNLKNLGDNIGSGLNNLGDSIGDSLDQLGNSLENKLDDIKNNQEQGFELQGDSALPDDNEYDSTVDEVEEESLTDAISEYISSGIPILSYINGTSLQLSGASSSMSVELWGSQVDFDLAPMADILDTMGYILSGISLIVAFGIIANR